MLLEASTAMSSTSPPAAPSLEIARYGRIMATAASRNAAAQTENDSGAPRRYVAGAEVGGGGEAGHRHRPDEQQRQANASEAGEPYAAAGGRHLQRRFPGMAEANPCQ